MSIPAARRFTVSAEMPLPDGRGLFASDNLGPSDTEYAFAEKISGVLRREDGASVIPEEQRPRYPMVSCVRHTLRSVTALKDGRTRIGYFLDNELAWWGNAALKDGRWLGAEGGIEGCGLARIREIYEIVNPASAVRALRSGRPAGGYGAERCLALGDAMFRAEIVHTVSPDGTVVTDFNYRTLQNVPWQGFLGLMYQEKCRPENGCVRRYIPGLRPFRDGGRRYDFSVPRDIALPFPASFAAGPDTWEDPEYPPDRQIEMILSGRAGGCVAFAAGILPEGDGRPEIRRRYAADALCPAPSRKSYITFWGASDPEKCEGRFTRARGAVFRRYYPSERDFSLCLIPRRDGGWLYADWMGKNGIIKERSFPLPGNLKPVLHRLGGDVSWRERNGVMNMRGSRGFAVWALRPGGAAGKERNG